MSARVTAAGMSTGILRAAAGFTEGGDRGGDRRGYRSNDRRGDSRSEQRYSNDSPHGEQSRWGGNSCYREHERDRPRSRRDYYSYD